MRLPTILAAALVVGDAITILVEAEAVPAADSQ
jgi:hypothetical protein